VAWRRAAAIAIEMPEDGWVLDLCCGTGDQALAIRRSGARVVAADFSIPMLALARKKFRQADFRHAVATAADALKLPLPTARFDVITVSFGLRNVENLQAALHELRRVLKPGGRLAVLEFATPRGRLLRPLYLLYSRYALPRIGDWLSPRGSAYRYLTDSVPGFPQRQGFLNQMSEVGFAHATWRDLSGGIVCLYTGSRSK
jgi:demethylmenaquinone methyltransferase/2-methoxy-6-polyprenyl-1,4-benzoquinol methylase